MTTIDPTRTALVAVHVQNDIVGPDGAFAPFFRAEIDRVGTLATAARLLDAARAAGVPVVYTRVAWRPDYSDLHANSPLLNIVVQQNCLVDGTPGAAITDELAPQDTDRVVTHQRVGGFHDSELDEVLRRPGSRHRRLPRRGHQRLRRRHGPCRVRPGLPRPRGQRRLQRRHARSPRRLARVPGPARRDHHHRRPDRRVRSPARRRHDLVGHPAVRPATRSAGRRGGARAHRCVRADCQFFGRMMDEREQSLPPRGRGHPLLGDG